MKLNVKENDKYGRLSVIRECEKELKGGQFRRTFLCKCDCGTEIKVILERLRSGHTSSCGCYKDEVSRLSKNKKWSDRERKLASIYHSIKQRCNNKNDYHYKWYGAKGIKLSDEWECSVDTFINDMIDSYQEGLTIDRINNDKGYSKYNCRWSTIKEQCNNRSTNVLLRCFGKEYTLTQLSEKYCINRKTIQQRLKRMTIEEAVTRPINGK